MKAFTKVQQEELQERMKTANIARDSMNQFINYLGKEYGADKDHQLSQDLSCFEKPKKAPKA